MSGPEASDQGTKTEQLDSAQFPSPGSESTSSNTTTKSPQSPKKPANATEHVSSALQRPSTPSSAKDLEHQGPVSRPNDTPASSRPKDFDRHVSSDTAVRTLGPAYEKSITRLPGFRIPLKDKSGPWLKEEHVATEWLSLFYDLIVVAVLSAFSSTHEIGSPSAIPVFLSYFAIISWVWVSQIQYDIRFQAEDGWHRVAKAFQIVIFVYMGAASGNWSSGLIQDPAYVDEISDWESTEHTQASTSFTTVLTAFAVSRGLLGLQYLICVKLGRHAGRPVRAILFTVLVLGISIILTVLAIVIPARTVGEVVAKNVLFYCSILAEIIGSYIQSNRKSRIIVRLDALAERHGAFTLIILGEGFINLVKAFSAAISGLSSSDWTTYGQVFLAISIMFCLWLFLFGRFKTEDTISSTRSEIWQAVHFPLHFVLLCFIASMVNTIIVLSYGHGIIVISEDFVNTIEGLQRNGTLPSYQAQQNTQSYLGQLPLFPSYITEVEIWGKQVNSTQPTVDATILAYQYFGQVMLQTTISYNLEVGESALYNLEVLYGLNATWTANETLRQEVRDQAGGLVEEIILEPVQTALSGILWLFPSAGLTLLLCAARSMIWYKYKGPSHWVIHGAQIGSGIILLLLTLLDIGGSKVELSGVGDLQDHNSLYRLLEREVPLLVVFLLYMITAYGPVVVLNILHRRTGDVFIDEEKTEPNVEQAQPFEVLLQRRDL